MIEEKLNEQGNKSSTKKILKRILFGTIGIVSGLLLTGWSLLLIYENEIKSQFISKINTYLTAKIEIDPNNIGIAWLATFPDASLKFKNAQVLDPENGNQKIISIGEIYFRFNLLDILNKKYQIKTISVKNSNFQLKTSKEGKHNFIFWKIPEQNENKTTKEQPVSFYLEQIKLDNIEFSYRNEKKEIQTTGKINYSVIKGNFETKKFDISSRGELFMEKLLIDNKTILNQKKISFNNAILIEEKKYDIKDLSLKINESKFNINGVLEEKEKTLKCEIAIDGEKLELKELISLLPEKTIASIKDYEIQGNAFFNGTIKGNLLEPDALNAKFNFGIDEGLALHIPSGKSFTDVQLTGSITKSIDKPEELSISSFKGKMGNNSFNSDFILTNFSDPFLKSKISIQTEISDLIQFYPIDTIEKCSGIAEIKSDIEGKIENLLNLEFEKMKINSDAILAGITLQFKKSKQIFALDSGMVNFNNRDLKLTNVIIRSEKNKLKLNGELNNFMNWLKKENEKLIISGKLNADVVYAEELLAMINENTKDELSHNSPEIDQTFKITELLKLDLTIDLKQLKWDKFIADDLTGSIKLNSGKIFSDKLQFKTCEGLVELSGFCETRVEKILVMGTAQLNGINIPKLFYSLDNFGQDLLQDKNLRGKGSVTANFNTEFSSNFSLIPESLKCESELTIEKGELIDFKPLEALSKYVELSELKRIQFNTLKTQVFIKDKKIELSKTEINNSALNIKISGSQDFNYNIDYRVSLLMSELMAKKPRKNKQLDEELRLVENDPENKRTVFLKLQGNVDDIKISYDRKSVKEKIKDDLRTEGKTLKNILQEEFKIFKRDTTMKKNPVQSDQKKPDAKIKQRKNKEIIESDNEDDDF